MTNKRQFLLNVFISRISNENAIMALPFKQFRERDSLDRRGSVMIRSILMMLLFLKIAFLPIYRTLSPTVVGINARQFGRRTHGLSESELWIPKFGIAFWAVLSFSNVFSFNSDQLISFFWVNRKKFHSFRPKLGRNSAESTGCLDRETG